MREVSDRRPSTCASSAVRGERTREYWKRNTVRAIEFTGIGGPPRLFRSESLRRGRAGARSGSVPDLSGEPLGVATVARGVALRGARLGEQSVVLALCGGVLLFGLLSLLRGISCSVADNRVRVLLGYGSRLVLLGAGFRTRLGNLPVLGLLCGPDATLLVGRRCCCGGTRRLVLRL